MVPHLYPKTPGTQKSAQNSQITVIFGQGKLKYKTAHKFELAESFNQKQISG